MSITNAPVLTEKQRSIPQLKMVDTYSRLLDTKFRIPGTNTRFGLDFIMGLVPGAGSLLGMAFSGILITTMARHGASGMLAVRMLLNVALDTIVGFVPVLGNIFDLYYKANYRNLQLMREYYDEGKHQGSAWPVVLFVLVVLVGMIIGTFYVGYLILAWLVGLF